MPSNPASGRTDSIRLVVDASGSTRTFKTVDVALGWLDHEETLWLERFGYGVRPATPQQSAQQHVRTQFEALKTAATNVSDTLLEVGDSGNTEGLDEARAHLAETFEHIYGAGLLFGSDSRQGNFVLEDGVPDAIRAGRLFGLVPIIEFGYNPRMASASLDGGVLHGLLEGTFFRLGIEPGVSARAARELADTTGRLSSELEELGERQGELLARRTHDLDLLVTSLRESARRITDEHVELQGAFQVRKAEVDAELEEWTRRVQDRIALEAPMTFWRAKGMLHQRASAAASRRAVTFGVCFTLFISGVVLLLFWPGLLDVEDYARIALLFVFSTFGIWTTRLLIRVFLSELHLATDAREKEVALKTYIALDAQQAEKLSPEDRRILLGYIFHPASTGIVSDDSAPANLSELVSRINLR